MTEEMRKFIPQNCEFQSRMLPDFAECKYKIPGQCALNVPAHPVRYGGGYFCLMDTVQTHLGANRKVYPTDSKEV